MGEHASCGDVAQIALWLALQAGQMDLLDDVERLVRARLLPSQIVDEKNPRRDGAWGVYSHPFGYGAILDVFAAVLHSLADIHGQCVSTSRRGAPNVPTVHLHFDADTSQLAVQSKRGAEASLIITPKRMDEPARQKPAGDGVGLRIRAPSWVTREKVRLTVENRALPLDWDGPYLRVSSTDIVDGSAITLQHDLPPRQTVEEMPISHSKYALTWRGDEVVSCDPKAPIYAPRP